MNTETLEKISHDDIRIEPSADTSNTSICYSVYIDKTFVGSASVSAKDTCHLEDVFIEREYRRKGLGSFLINKLKITNLNCTTWNLKGIIFYNTIGFTETYRDIYLITFSREYACMK